MDRADEIRTLRNAPVWKMGLPYKESRALIGALRLAIEVIKHGEDRVREFLAADRDGRCLILPCKKGDRVYRIVNDADPHITLDQCMGFQTENGETWILLVGGVGMGCWNFGKLLFLTEEEAEAALEGENNESI